MKFEGVKPSSSDKQIDTYVFRMGYDELDLLCRVISTAKQAIPIFLWREAGVKAEKGRLNNIASSLREAKRYYETKRAEMVEADPSTKFVQLKKRERKDISRMKKDSILVRDKYTCAYCGIHRMNLTLDHIIPVSKGGTDASENLVACCHRCNAKKGDKLVPNPSA